MPQDQKTSINNLLIVWQGSSWSVITARGKVLDRFKSKPHACSFARGIFDHLDEEGDYGLGNDYRGVLSTSLMPVSSPFKTIRNKNKNLFTKRISRLGQYGVKLLFLTISKMMIFLGYAIWEIFAPLLNLIFEAALQITLSIFNTILAPLVWLIIISSGIITASLCLGGLVAIFSSFPVAVMWWIAAFITAIICKATYSFAESRRWV